MSIQRLSFSLRKLFFTVATCAAALGYLAYNTNLVRQRSALRRLMREPPYAARTIGLYNDMINGTTSTPVPWLRRMLGDYGERTILYSPTNDRDGSILKEVERIQWRLVYSQREV
jgi:hypothetical protein